MKDFKAFLSNNENRNLWFSAMACGMTFAIVIFALACSAVMVFGASPTGYPAFKDASNQETLYFSTIDFKLVENGSGLYDAICENSFSFEGVLTQGGGWNSAGSRGSSMRSITIGGDTKDYYIIPDVIWTNNIVDNDSIYTFDNANRDTGIKSLFDPSLNNYASNYNRIFQTNNNLNDLFDISLNNQNSNNVTLNIKPKQDFPSEYQNADISFAVKCWSYALYTSSGIHLQGNKLPKEFLNQLIPNGVMRVDNHTYTNPVGVGSANQAQTVLLRSDSVSSSGSPVGFSSLGLAPACYAVCSSQPYGVTLLSQGNSSLSKQFTFDQSVFVSGAHISSIENNLTGATISTTANQQWLGYQVKIEVQTRDSNGNLASSPIYAYALSNGVSWVGTGSLNTNNGTTTTTTNDDGTISIDSTTSYNDVGTIGNLSNENIIDFVKNGMGLGGSNGLIMLVQQSFSFIPQEIWSLIFAGLALSIVLMIIKILRGMG